MAGEYLSSPSRSSGGRYHSVITLLVYGRLEMAKNNQSTFSNWYNPLNIETYAAAFPNYETSGRYRHLVDSKEKRKDICRLSTNLINKSNFLINFVPIGT